MEVQAEALATATPAHGAVLVATVARVAMVAVATAMPVATAVVATALEPVVMAKAPGVGTVKRLEGTAKAPGVGTVKRLVVGMVVLLGATAGAMVVPVVLVVRTVVRTVAASMADMAKVAEALAVVWGEKNQV
jgi:hypothetical protein